MRGKGAETMTDDELAAIEDRATKATTGPWLQGEWTGRCTRSHFPHPGPPGCRYENQFLDAAPFDRYVSTEGLATLIGGNDYGPWLNPEDARFIAAARSDVPALVAEVRRLREVERIATETLSLIARCGCSACGTALPDTRATRSMADDALTNMSVVE
jgi:hypothetical protein